MNPSSGNPGISRLGKVLQQRMKEVNAAPLVLDFGVIQSDYSLLTNTFPIAIPQTDYTVCRQLTLGETGSKLTTTAKDGSHDVYTEPYPEPVYEHVGIGENHQHDVLIPERMRWLKPGDRVLVAWVQNDAVVIDIVLPATAIG